MTYEEVIKELELLRAAGLHPMLCDTEVPLVDVPVLAGIPSDAGDVTSNEYVLMPRKLVGQHPVFLIDVNGLSMHDADIMPGDRLEVQMDTAVSDGDIVVAEVDGGFTVKAFFTDGDGRKWLVPQNTSFSPIQLENRPWRIIGKVIGLRKGIPRASYADCAKAVLNASRQTRSEDAATLPPEQPAVLIFRKYHQRRAVDYNAVRQAVERVVLKQMRHAYEWYAAYRVLMDLGLIDDPMLTHFAQQMNVWFPDASIRCSADRMGDYAVGYTAKSSKLWNIELYRRDMRQGQSITAFNTLLHRCEELHAALFPLPLLEPGLPF